MPVQQRKSRFRRKGNSPTRREHVLFLGSGPPARTKQEARNAKAPSLTGLTVIHHAQDRLHAFIRPDPRP